MIYQMLISNIAAHINSAENKKAIDEGKGLNVFTASEVLSVALCKAKEEIAQDIILEHDKQNAKQN